MGGAHCFIRHTSISPRVCVRICSTQILRCFRFGKRVDPLAVQWRNCRSNSLCLLGERCSMFFTAVMGAFGLDVTRLPLCPSAQEPPEEDDRRLLVAMMMRVCSYPGGPRVLRFTTVVRGPRSCACGYRRNVFLLAVGIYALCLSANSFTDCA